MNLALWTLLCVVSADAPTPDIAVVCPAAWRSAMQTWVDRRTAQGHIVEFVSNHGTAEHVRRRIDTIADGRRLRFVLLVGDARSASESSDALRTPTFHLVAKVNHHWGGDPQLASDNPYADFDGDQLPDVAIGRIPARSAEELARILQKSLDYEDNPDFGQWRSRINFVAGEGGYGSLADRLLEAAAEKCIACGVPRAYTTTMTYANWRSPYCPDPHSFHESALSRLNEGSLFWVFMGHGLPHTLQWAMFPDGRCPILQCEDCRNLACQSPPIAVLFCCYTGAFAEADDCLAEQLLRAEGGPAAVISSSNVTMPYGMTALGRGLMREHFVERRATLGELLLHAKRSTMVGYEQPFWSLVNALTVALAPASIHPKAERLEHVQLFNLLGDPTIRLRHPMSIAIEAPNTMSAGQEIEIEGESPVDGHCTIELRPRRELLRASPARSLYDGSQSGRVQFAAVYRSANESQWSILQTKVQGGRFHVRLRIPDDAAGPCCLRARIAGENDFALGSLDLYIDRKAAD